MTEKKLPFTKKQILDIIKKYPTPFHLYDEKATRAKAKNLIKAFSWAPGFKEYFAVKANSNPHLIKILKEEGFGVDCSSLVELVLAEKLGFKQEEIFFSSNNTPWSEYQKALNLGVIVNLDDFSHINFIEKRSNLPEIISFRYNPGDLKTGNEIIGNPKEAKYGFTKEQLFEGYKYVKEKGAKRFGLHTMVASNELNPDYFVETARMLFELVLEISKKLKIRFEFVNLGGGFGIPYRPEEKKIDLNYVSSQIEKEYQNIIKKNNLHPLKIYMESGRMITGPYGYLVTKVLHKKVTYKNYVGVDACMADLMRPAIYGAYHHLTVLGKENEPLDFIYDVTGSLCENNDKFAINRKLPLISVDDLIVIHDTGAHGYVMGFNYNGKLKSAELLLKEDGQVEQIRRAETIDDYFATLDFPR